MSFARLYNLPGFGILFKDLLQHVIMCNIMHASASAVHILWVCHRTYT